METSRDSDTTRHGDNSPPSREPNIREARPHRGRSSCRQGLPIQIRTARHPLSSGGRPAPPLSKARARRKRMGGSRRSLRVGLIAHRVTEPYRAFGRDVALTVRARSADGIAKELAAGLAMSSARAA